MSVRPQSGLTESTSSSRSRAASGRPSGWPTLHARSASASCSAAWSNRASGSPRPARSRACAITSISTATSSLPTTRGKGSSSWTVSNFHPSSRVWVSEKRYLVLAEGKALDPHYGKTARGVILYGPHPVSALVDSENTGADVEGIPVVASVEDGLAVEPRANTALVGVALAGGRLPAEWRVLLRAFLEAGLDLESGMHELLSEDRELADLARRHGAEIRDLRKPPADLSVSSGANLLQDATVVLTVGSDCAIGKKSVAIELDREARGRGLRSVFVPTGQTGIAIAGWGIAVDAVVADFLAGATEIDGCPGHPIPPLPELVDLHEALALPARPARVAAIALNTHRLGNTEARRAIDEAEEETGLPAEDPVRFGPVRLLDAVLQRLPSDIRTGCATRVSPGWPSSSSNTHWRSASARSSGSTRPTSRRRSLSPCTALPLQQAASPTRPSPSTASSRSCSTRVRRSSLPSSHHSSGTRSRPSTRSRRSGRRRTRAPCRGSTRVATHASWARSASFRTGAGSASRPGR